MSLLVEDWRVATEVGWARFEGAKPVFERPLLIALLQARSASKWIFLEKTYPFVRINRSMNYRDDVTAMAEGLLDTLLEKP